MCFTGAAPSHLWLGATPATVVELFFWKPASFPRGGFQPSWDCNVTPPYCSCQEGNTIGCISSNDGLDAGVREFFPQKEIHCLFTNIEERVRSGVWAGKTECCERNALVLEGEPRAPKDDWIRAARPRPLLKGSLGQGRRTSAAKAASIFTGSSGTSGTRALPGLAPI